MAIALRRDKKKITSTNSNLDFSEAVSVFQDFNMLEVMKKALLKRTRLNNAGLAKSETKDTAEDLAIFVKLQNDHEGKLELLHKIYEGFPALAEEASFPPLFKEDILFLSCQYKAVHEVPSFRFVFLHRANVIMRDVPPLLNIVSCKWGCGCGWPNTTV